MLKFEELPEINSKRWLSLETLDGEEWRDVVGYEDYFQISSYGRLKRKKVVVERCNNHGVYTIKERILSLNPDNRGYVFKCASVYGKPVNFNIHRLVAMAFVPNPNNYTDVNHIDENHSDNIYTNLEWCTRKYNTNYGTNIKRAIQTKIDKGLTRKVVLYTYEGEFVKEYNSIDEAGRDTGTNSVMIGRCCSGKIASAMGLHFRYKGEKYEKREIKINRLFLKAIQNDGSVIECRYGAELCRKIDISYNSLINVLYHKTKQMTPPYNGIIEVTDTYGKKVNIINGIIV